ncbi:MAG: hypothetical protein RMJ48_13430 [Roseiflexaceae bacterium]|nr:hypothetical protein [Roseiflexaceae bacterium]
MRSCSNSPLTPLLEPLWRQRADRAALIAALKAHRAAATDPALARDLALALSVLTNDDWSDLPAPERQAVAVRITWRWLSTTVHLAEKLDRTLARARDFDRNRALNLASDRALVRALARSRDFDRDRALVRALARALVRDRTLARALARPFARFLDRARARALVRDYDHDRDRDHWNEICDEIAQVLDQAESAADAGDRPAIAQARAALYDVRALATESGFNEWSMATNTLADEVERHAAAPAALSGRGRVRLTATTPDPAASLTPALRAALQLPDDNDPGRSAALERVRDWLTSDDPVARASAGLLLLEAGERAPKHVTAALDLLTSPHDLFRYRAYRALVRDTDADEWPLPAIKTLARVALGQHGRADAPAGEAYLREMYAGWALDRIRHTRADWIVEWIARSDAGDPVSRRILRSIHRLADECWSPLLDGLRTAGPATQDAILNSLSWLLQNTPPDHPHLPVAVDALLDLSAAPAPVGPAALRALGSARALSAEQAARLCRLAEQPDPPEALWATLARLSALPDADAINAALAAAPDTSAVRAARVRQVVQRYSIAPEKLAGIAPEPRDRLAALLAAGTDNDVWGDYHERIADAIRDLLTAHDDLLPELLTLLHAPLTDETWPAQRIALAALAQCAAAMPERFNDLAATSDLVTLLLAITAHPHSFSARRFAIIALAALREINADVLAALFRLAGDTATVQDDVIAAAQRLNRLHPALGERLPEELVQALTGESAIRAYVAAQVLEALGASAATMITPGLRRQIVTVLADALRDPRSRRSVWRWDGDDIKEDGTLDQHFYRALLRVAGFRVE